MGGLLRLVCLGLLAPAFALAQRPSLGSLGRGKIGQLSHEPGIEIPAIVNPVNLLIEHRQELALSDTQFKRVIGIKRALDSTNAPLVRKLDSVARVFKTKPLFTEPSPERRDSWRRRTISCAGRRSTSTRTSRTRRTGPMRFSPRRRL